MCTVAYMYEYVSVKSLKLKYAKSLPTKIAKFSVLLK